MASETPTVRHEGEVTATRQGPEPRCRHAGGGQATDSAVRVGDVGLRLRRGHAMRVCRETRTLPRSTPDRIRGNPYPGRPPRLQGGSDADRMPSTAEKKFSYTLHRYEVQPLGIRGPGASHSPVRRIGEKVCTFPHRRLPDRTPSAFGNPQASRTRPISACKFRRPAAGDTSPGEAVRPGSFARPTRIDRHGPHPAHR
jgi:hypothetical protein